MNGQSVQKQFSRLRQVSGMCIKPKRACIACLVSGYNNLSVVILIVGRDCC